MDESNQNTPALENIPQPELEGSQPPANPNPPAPATNILDNLYSQAYLEEKVARENAEKRIRELESARNAPPTQNNDQNFFESPSANISALIRQELATSLAPLQQDFQVMRRREAYNNLKNQVKAANVLPDFNELESMIDQIMVNQEPNVENLKNAVIYARGMRTFNAPATPQNNTPVPAMPYIPPSPPAAPPRNNNTAPRQLTELEKRIARESGMTEAEYLADLDKNVALLSTAKA